MLPGMSDWASMQRPAIQITSGAERLPSHSGQRRPGRPDLAQPLKALQAGARSNSGDGLLARRSSQGALLPAEEPGRVWRRLDLALSAAMAWQVESPKCKGLHCCSCLLLLRL